MRAFVLTIGILLLFSLCVNAWRFISSDQVDGTGALTAVFQALLVAWAAALLFA